jgi:nitric oxide reductase NorQ protein
MNPSTRQRFVSMRFDYPDMATEQTIVQKETDIDEETAIQLIELAHALRVLKDHDLEESASTRLLVYAATLIKSGFPIIDACRAAIIEPLSDDEETVQALMEVVRAKIQ